jgi:hypothetical protein
MQLVLSELVAMTEDSSVPIVEKAISYYIYAKANFHRVLAAEDNAEYVRRIIEALHTVLAEIQKHPNLQFAHKESTIEDLLAFLADSIHRTPGIGMYGF